MVAKARGGLFLVALLLPAPAARAWNDHGHMVVAALAYRQLTPGARARATALVRLNPEYARWIAGVAPADRDQVAFLRASTWADAIKRDARYVNDPDRPRGGPAMAAAAVAEARPRPAPGYEDRLQHRDWHFIDLAFSADDTRGRRPPAPNVETQIAALRTTLAARDAPDLQKSHDLVWLLHLVGDVHQPLHCVSRFDRPLPNGDRGGNAIHLCAPPCTDTLHGFWDAAAGDGQDPATAWTQAADLPPAETALAAAGDTRTWIAESVAAARQSVYVAPVGEGDGPFTLDARYEAQARRTARQRLALAGARLARLINRELR